VTTTCAAFANNSLTCSRSRIHCVCNSMFIYRCRLAAIMQPQHVSGKSLIQQMQPSIFDEFHSSIFIYCLVYFYLLYVYVYVCLLFQPINVMCRLGPKPLQSSNEIFYVAQRRLATPAQNITHSDHDVTNLDESSTMIRESP
jgi:hypothetical protein